MPFADIRGQRLCFEDTGGQGPVVLLGHGFLMDQTMFAAQVEALAPRYRVVTWDARGFGLTEWDGQPFSYWDLAEDALALLDHLKIDRAVLGGMSQGGFLSLRAALKAPERVAALVLFSTQAGVDAEHVTAGYRQMMDTWVTVGAVDPLVASVASIILGEPEHWQPWTERWKAMPKTGLREPALCLMDRDDVSSRLGEIKAPAIVFHGTADRAIGMDRAEALANGLQGCRELVKVDGGGHSTNLTHAHRVNPALLDFLASVI